MVSKIKLNNKYIRTCRQYLRTQSGAVKNEMRDSIRFYRANAKYGWQQGKRLAQIKQCDRFQAVFLKLYASLLKTRIRAKDLPAIMGSLGAITPFPGGTIAGFISGKLIYGIIKRFK